MISKSPNFMILIYVSCQDILKTL